MSSSTVAATINAGTARLLHPRSPAMVQSSVAIRRRDGLRDSRDGLRLRRKLVPRQRGGRVALAGLGLLAGKSGRVGRDYHRRAMTSQWLAVGADTDPLRRARELQRSWERLLADGALVRELPPLATAGLRPRIVESWRRSLATGLDPTDSLAPIEADESEVLERWLEHPLGSLTHVVTEQLRKLAEESRGMVVVTDASGLVLHRVGDERLKERAAEMNLVEGARYSEAADGTNGIGTALAADRAFQVFAFEHFNERHHEWVCSGAPVHDPVSGQTIGLIDLSSLWKVAHPRSLELVTTAARTIEHLPPGGPARSRRSAETSLRRFHDEEHGSAREPRRLRTRGRRAGALETLDVPEDGGEVVLGDGSVAVAASLGQGEAYLLRRVSTRRARSAPVEVLERAERHVRELAAEQAALRQVATLVARESSPISSFRRRRAGRPRLRRPARQAGPLRAGKLGGRRRLQRGGSRAVPDRIALAAGQSGCNPQPFGRPVAPPASRTTRM